MMFDSGPSIMPLVKSGKLRAPVGLGTLSQFGERSDEQRCIATEAVKPMTAAVLIIDAAGADKVKLDVRPEMALLPKS